MLYLSKNFFFILIIVNCQLHHQQYFKTRPQPNVDVIEGGSVILQCAIGNQKGSVQWAKDGFVLGLCLVYYYIAFFVYRVSQNCRHSKKILGIEQEKQN
jgi:hypothetical protein